MSVTMQSDIRFPSPQYDRTGPLTRRTFGRRAPVGMPAGRFSGVDHDLTDLRRRIDQNTQHLPARLPVTVGSVVMLSVSAALWVNLLGFAHLMFERFVVNL